MPTNPTTAVEPISSTAATVTTPISAVPAPTALTAANPTVSGTSPSVSVTVPNTSGTVTFQLIVTDNLGTQSAPATVTVQIQPAPTAKLVATPSVVAHGQTITLSADGSTAPAPGSIAKYTFTLENPTSTTG